MPGKPLAEAISEAVAEMRLGAGALAAVNQNARSAALLRYAELLQSAAQNESAEMEEIGRALEQMSLSKAPPSVVTGRKRDGK